MEIGEAERLEREARIVRARVERRDFDTEVATIGDGGHVKVIRNWLPEIILKDGFVPNELYESTYTFGHCEQIEKSLCMPVEPLISRMGGKKQIVAFLVSKMPRDVQTYVEPFFGSGRVFLSRPWRNRIEITNDVDQDLVHFYRYAIFDPEGLIRLINAMPTHEGIILGLRRTLAEDVGSMTSLERAAAFYICARSSFNAIATNQLGRYGSSPHVLINTSITARDVHLVAERLRNVDFRCTSYKRLLSAAVKPVPRGLFVYMDPPYDQTEGYESWSTGELSFGWVDQVALSEFCVQIDRVGGRFIQTNSATDRLKELYGSYKRSDGSPMFHIMTRAVYYSISGVSDKRRETNEFIISNYDLTDQVQRRLFQ